MGAFTGIWIPAGIWHLPKLSFGHRILLGHIDGLAEETGRCHPTNAYLCQFMDLEDRQVRKLLHDLKSRNFIATEGEGKGREIIPTWLNSAGLESTKPGEIVPDTVPEPGDFSPQPGIISPGSPDQPGDFSPTNPAIFNQQPGTISPPLYKDGNKEEAKEKIEEEEIVRLPDEVKVREMLLNHSTLRDLTRTYERKIPYEKIVDHFLLVRGSDPLIRYPFRNERECINHFREWMPKGILKMPHNTTDRPAPEKPTSSQPVRAPKPSAIETHAKAKEMSDAMVNSGLTEKFDPYGLNK